MLTFDVKKRITAEDALKHPYVVLWRKQEEVDLEPSQMDEIESESIECLYGSILVV
jgi:hypothetical protein